METTTTNIPVLLPNGVTAYIEGSIFGGEENVSADLLSFDNVIGIIEGISQGFKNAMHKVKPSKGTVEFSLEVGLKTGQLTALIVKGDGKANLKITLEWKSKAEQETALDAD